jgi:glycerol uptake facilitator-like aquaporin
MRQFIAELIGRFILVFFACGTAVIAAWLLAIIARGALAGLVVRVGAVQTD